MVNQRELTEEGLEKNFATNTLGKYFQILVPVHVPIFETILFLDTLLEEM